MANDQDAKVDSATEELEVGHGVISQGSHFTHLQTCHARYLASWDAQHPTKQEIYCTLTLKSKQNKQNYELKQEN